MNRLTNPAASEHAAINRGVQRPVSSARIIVFGASGSTGRCLVDQALGGGDQVTAFVRNAERAAFDDHERLRVIEGDIHDEPQVRAAIAGHDEVYFTLGAKLFARGVRESATRNIITAMEAVGVSRLISMSSYGVGDTEELLPAFTKYIVVPFMLRRTFDDHFAQETLIEASSLDWTIVRPPYLTNDERTEDYSHGLPIGDVRRFKIPRGDVGHFMLRVGREGLYRRQKPGVSC